MREKTQEWMELCTGRRGARPEETPATNSAHQRTSQWKAEPFRTPTRAKPEAGIIASRFRFLGKTIQQHQHRRLLSGVACCPSHPQES